MMADYLADQPAVLNKKQGVQVSPESIGVNCTTKMHIAAKAGFTKKIAGLVLLLFLSITAFSQKEAVPGWHLLDARQDGYHGISLAQAKELLKDRKPQPVVVAVMDGGIDTTHQSLRPVLWTNPREIAGNGKDDDGNGYVDDVHGWNFLGNKKGENVNKESQEAVRIYHKLKDKFLNKPFDSAGASAQTKTEYALWKRSNELLEIKPEEKQALGVVQLFVKANRVNDSLLRTEWGRNEYTSGELENYLPKSNTVKKAKMGYLRFLEILEMDPDKTNRQVFSDVDEFLAQQKELINGKEIPSPNYRDSITHDDEDNFATRNYGNADVMGGTSLHGTHVSGIIAGMPDSNFTGGVCAAAKIMMIRCIPNGDEHDKDVALGIRYAVDNGASVINMSFGKGLSPHKAWVDDALRYAASRNVLVIHASGNDGKNTDIDPDYPTSILNDKTEAPTVIGVGASGDGSLSGGILATFTNYGPKTVDVLAPGVMIYSCLPGNLYGNEQGTSMASPVVAGVAALLRSYFPKLSAVQVKQIIEQSVDDSMENKRFRKPDGGKKETITLKEACKTGGIVNAYKAVKLALEME